MKHNNAVGNKNSGRKGYNHEIVIRLAYDIVEKELRGKCDKEITRKDKFNASLELVKKAIPNNFSLDDKTLEILFAKVFNEKE